jgi:hypothetical protein
MSLEMASNNLDFVPLSGPESLEDESEPYAPMY